MTLLTALSGREVYLDSNIFIYLIEDHPVYAEHVSMMFSLMDSGAQLAATSALTRAEVMVRPLRTKNVAAQHAYLEALTPHAGLAVIPVTDDVLLESARLRAEYTKLRLPDAIHLATARRSNCSVLLTNDRRFTSSEDIQIIVLSEILDGR